MSSLSLNEERQEILHKFRENLVDVIKPTHDDRFLLRWLRARDFDLQKAEAMLRADLKYREKMGSDTIVGRYELKKEMQPYEGTNFLGFSRDGHPVRQINFGISDIKGITRSMTLAECVDYFIHMMESDLKRLEERNLQNSTHVETCVYICDFENFRLRHTIDRKVARLVIHLIKLYQDHYPERLHHVFMINVPTLFPYFFNLFKPFFHENVIKKFFAYRPGEYQEPLFKLVPKEIVPAYLGGYRYGPDGDPRCSNIMNWRSKIPVSIYLSNLNNLKADDPGVCRKTIRPRSIFEIEKEVDKPGMMLCWEFQTKDYDIRFGVLFRRNSNRSEGETVKEEVVPVENVDSHEVLEKADIVCKNIGTYILLFDNTYSWFISKQLLYRVAIKPSSNRSSVEDLNC